MTETLIEALTRLERAGKLTAEAVVDEGRDPASPFHASLEWDDSVAGHQFRLVQARLLIRHRRVVVGEKHVPIRRFTHVRSEGVYQDTLRAVRDHREEVLATARRDLRTFREKYRILGSDVLLQIAREILGDEAGHGKAEPG